MLIGALINIDVVTPTEHTVTYTEHIPETERTLGFFLSLRSGEIAFQIEAKFIII